MSLVGLKTHPLHEILTLLDITEDCFWTFSSCPQLATCPVGAGVGASLPPRFVLCMTVPEQCLRLRLWPTQDACYQFLPKEAPPLSERGSLLCRHLCKHFIRSTEFDENLSQ